MDKNKNSETSQQILNAALSLWSEKGYEASTMRELARRLGMGASSLYFYFESKEEIVHYLYAAVNERAMARFAAEDDGEKDLGKNLARYLTIKVELLEPQRGCIAAIFKEAVDPASRLSPVSHDSEDVLRASTGFFRELVERAGVPEDRRERSARLVWVLHVGVLLYWLHDRSPNAANSRKLIAKTTALTGLAPLVERVPGADELVELLSAVLEPPTSAEPAALEVEREEAPLREVDVVVIGAGPIGVLYASFLKRARPKTSILVLDKALEPGHKIGESTLSGFCKALRSVGIRQETQQRLFYPKNGLGFFHVTEATRDVAQAPEYVLETFDETFQVERRVLDGLCVANAERLGIEVVRGAQVSLPASRLGAKKSVVAYDVGPRTYRVKASIVVDASGPAGALSRALGVRTDDDTAFQTGSVWTYFSGLKPLASRHGYRGKAQFPRDHYTEHLCFREGWLWHIPIVSWQAAPTANLNRLYERVLGARSLPSREELEEAYACPTEPITSIGLSLRMDRDPRMQDDPRGAFEHYRKRYPAIGALLDGGRIREDHYGPNTTFMSRLNYRGHATQVAGDGWLLVGDAAFFVDPLISPGLTGGTAGAWHAARVSVAALDAGRVERERFADYELFIGALQPALERDNELVYMSFNHPELLALVQRFQEIDARRHFHEHRAAEYGEEDTNVWGILTPAYQELQLKAWAMCREEEDAVAKEVSVAQQTPADYERLLERMRALLGPYVEGHVDLTPYVRQNREGRTS